MPRSLRSNGTDESLTAKTDAHKMRQVSAQPRIGPVVTQNVTGRASHGHFPAVSSQHGQTLNTSDPSVKTTSVSTTQATRFTQLRVRADRIGCTNSRATNHTPQNV